MIGTCLGAYSQNLLKVIYIGKGFLQKRQQFWNALSCIYIGEIACENIHDYDLVLLSLAPWVAQHKIESIAYGLFTLVTFVSETIGDSIMRQSPWVVWQLLTWPPWAGRQEIKTILYVLHRPRWPRQEQWWVSLVAVAGIIVIMFANVNRALGVSSSKVAKVSRGVIIALRYR